jgi:integral membrane protein (TIGR01906 family)|tara:strand:- start:303 stop:896 length:594 start_codon:yes stop_codon:yes gene_type:complete
MLIVAMISASLNFLIRYDFIYEYNLSTNESIQNITSLSIAELTDINNNIRDYFFNDDELLNVDIYSDKEIAHMKDVKNLISLVLSVGKYSAVSFLIFFFFLNNYFSVSIASLLKKSLLIFISFSIILALAFGLFFNQVFLLFHELSFSNDLWILNPNTDYLLMMFPEVFFRDVAVMIILLSFVLHSSLYALISFLNK